MLDQWNLLKLRYSCTVFCKVKTVSMYLQTFDHLFLSRDIYNTFKVTQDRLPNFMVFIRVSTHFPNIIWCFSYSYLATPKISMDILQNFSWFNLRFRIWWECKHLRYERMEENIENCSWQVPRNTYRIRHWTFIM